MIVRFLIFSWRKDGKIDLEALKEKLSHVDAVFLCNPSNPTGLYYSQEVILPILIECERQNCALIVDEAFHDFVMDYEPLAPLFRIIRSLILLRSLTKMFAIPGIRLGYVMANCEIIAKLSSYQPHWSVNSVALAVEICV